ncbi:cyclic lactone autoinducer peptide [Ruminiclostridium josui]|nr:cyclic lactone autoinducer peptide [Ruminiclostridium josui]
MNKKSKLLSIIDSNVTAIAEKKAENFSFLWGHQPRVPKSLKTIKK